jgi:putative tryptophan/tyrosine transport system substrate-binding protein
MRRREFIAGLGGAAVAWPVVVRAQQPDRLRRIGVLMGFDENDPESKAEFSVFTQGLAELGWTDGRNVHMDVRWAAGNVDRMRTFAKELVRLQPDVILANTTPATAALQRETRTIPIVFVGVGDPIGDGFVAGLSRPGGNITGFIYTEAAMAGKWVELLTEIAPSVKRVAMIVNPDNASGRGSYFQTPFETAARSLKVEATTVPVRSEVEIETVITALGRAPGGGLVPSPDSFMFVHRAAIISLAAQHHIPAVYYHRAYAKDGGLLTYGPDRQDQFRRSASHVDRILRGAKPADLPVQVPVKFEMVINAKTAKALGLTVPQSILLRADEVIE